MRQFLGGGGSNPLGNARSRRLLRAALATITMVATTLGISATPASAAGARPDFLLPVPCGTTWHLSTYDSYKGFVHKEAVDLNLASGEDSGQRVLAASGGRVIATGGTWGEVKIDHGNGWKTRYLHMTNIAVRTNDVVIPGQRIGYVGNKGVEGDYPHLHYEMYQDDVMRRPVFDGETVQWNRTSGEREATHLYSSTNCLAGRDWAPEFAGQMIRHPGGTIDFVAANGYRYWVPNSSVVACLGGTVANVSDAVFNSIPRNQQGDPAGRWADCSTKLLNRLIHHPNGTVDYVDALGSRHYVPSDGVVACLGGWASVVNLDAATFESMPRNPYGTWADCATQLVGRVIRHPGGTIDFVTAKRLRYYIPSMTTVSCLGPASAVVEVSADKFELLQRNQAGTWADCNTELRNRLIRKSDGTVDYVTSAGYRYWVPNSQIVTCLGGWSSTIYLESARFNAIPRNPGNAWANCSTKTL